MRNPFFRRQVDDLFAKLAVFDLGDVAKRVPEPVAADIGRGEAMGRAFQRAVESTPDVLRAGGRVLQAVLRPAPDVAAKPFFGALRGVAKMKASHPRLGRGALGLALTSPILGSAFIASQHKNEDQLMNLRDDPGRDVTASLDDFLEKKANAARGLMRLPAMGGKFQESFVGGIGSGVAQSLLSGLGSVLANGASGLKELLLTDRRRRQLFDTLLAHDVILHDALERTPAVADTLEEAYATLCRFAPSLSLDVNAVRSFLREVVVGGSGVNYATIKNLIETERALHNHAPGR